MLEGIKSKITNTEEWLSDKEDRIIEIITMEKSKEKRMKWEQLQKSLGQPQTQQHSHYRGPRRRREREGAWGNIWRDDSRKLPWNEKEKIQAQEAQSPTQHKHKEGYAETDIKQSDRNQRQRKILKRRGKQETTYTGTSHKVISWVFKKNHAGHMGVAWHLTYYPQ